MATTKTAVPTTVFAKLAQARVKFLEKGAKKSGKNMHLEFLYFELEDIVPTATRIFQEVGLLGIVNISKDVASMLVYDTDNMDTPPIIFTVPFREMDPIISNSGKVVTNAMQALGMSVTYLRRYLWMLALDVVEADEINANIGADVPVASTGSNMIPLQSGKKQDKKPATPKQREAVKQELTNTEAPADQLQLDGLKKACKELLKLDPEKDEFIQEIAVKTEGFTNATKQGAEKLIGILNEMLMQYEQEGNNAVE